MTTAPTGTRATRQRTAVSAVLDSVGDFRSAQELHDLLKQRGDAVGLTTVYRTLQSLAEAGEVDVLRTSDGESVYRRCSRGHHHHLVCSSCQSVVELGDCELTPWLDRVAADHGFVATAHRLDVAGLCAACRARP